MSLQETTLISILDDYLIEYADACLRKDPNIRYVDWLQGRIGGILLAGRISGTLNREATHLLQHATDHWYRYTVREA